MSDYKLVNFWYLDKYKEIGDSIGSGAFSTVHQVISIADGKEYAAKKVKQDAKCGYKRAGETFKKEIKILRILKPQKFLVNMIECFPKPPYVIILDLVKGGELFDEIVRRGKYNENDRAPALCAQCVVAQKFCAFLRDAWLFFSNRRAKIYLDSDFD